MSKLIRSHLYLLSIALTGFSCNAPKRLYTVADAHSHNDYKNSIPFHRAYNAGFGSIEADVYAVNGALMVAHDEKEISPERSLKILYTDPLIEKFKHDTTRQLRLLIEIKKDYTVTLPLVITELKPLSKYFNYPGHKGQLSIVMTGAVPPAAVMAQYPDWMLFDIDHIDGFTQQQLTKVGLISVPFTRYANWNGIEPINKQDANRLKGIIDSVHVLKRKIRFWGDPDTMACWLTLIKLNADVIGTDHIEELADFLNKKLYLKQ